MAHTADDDICQRKTGSKSMIGIKKKKKMFNLKIVLVLNFFKMRNVQIKQIFWVNQISKPDKQFKCICFRYGTFFLCCNSTFYLLLWKLYNL